jgi:hypothetical protein
LERSGADLGRQHRETLELRLAAEELLVLAPNSAAGDSSASEPSGRLRPGIEFEALRSRLADGYRLEAIELQRQRSELDSLKVQLAEDLGKLRDRQAELARWVALRESELLASSERLSVREAELERQAADFQNQLDAWSEERLSFQQEILRLKAKNAFPEKR